MSMKSVLSGKSEGSRCVSREKLQEATGVVQSGWCNHTLEDWRKAAMGATNLGEITSSTGATLLTSSRFIEYT